MQFPEDLYYTKDHEWLRPDGDGRTYVIGITEFAQQELGDIVFVELEPVGTSVDANAAFGTVEAVKTVSELFTPLSGTITAHNEQLEQRPELVNEDPYGEGWMIRFEADAKIEGDGLLTSAAYKEMVGE